MNAALFTCDICVNIINISDILGTFVLINNIYR